MGLQTQTLLLAHSQGQHHFPLQMARPADKQAGVHLPPCAGGPGNPAGVIQLQSRHVHSGSKPYLQLHCSWFANKPRAPEELICIHLPKTMWICPKYMCEFWVWKYWSLKRWEEQDLTTKAFLLCCSFQWAKQNYRQFSPIWSVIRQGTGLSATYFKLLKK